MFRRWVFLSCLLQAACAGFLWSQDEGTGPAKPATLATTAAPAGAATTDAAKPLEVAKREGGRIQESNRPSLAPAPLLSLRYGPAAVPVEEVAPRFTWRNLVFHPYGSAAASYTDNVNGAPDADAKHETLVNATAGLDLRYTPRDNMLVSLDLSGGWNEYALDNAKDYLTLDGKLQFLWQDLGMQGLSLLVHETYGQTGNVGVLEEQYAAHQRLAANTAGLIVSLTKEKYNLGASYSFGILDYLGGDTVSRQDYNFHEANLLFSYLVNERLVPYATYRFCWYSYPNDEIRDYMQHSLVLGLRAQLAEKLLLDVNVGGGLIDPDVSGADIRTDFLGGLRAQYTFNPKTALEFSLRRSQTVVASGDTSVLTDARLGAGVKPMEPLLLRPNLILVVEQRENLDNLKTYGGELRADYQVKEYLKAVAGYRYLRRVSNRVAGLDTIINTVFLGAEVRF